MWKIATLCVLLIFLQVNCWKNFHHGRGFGGNLGKPGNGSLVYSDEFPEQWFTQKLDHFNPNNEVTWKQVGIMFKQF